MVFFQGIEICCYTVIMVKSYRSWLTKTDNPKTENKFIDAVFELQFPSSIYIVNTSRHILFRDWILLVCFSWRYEVTFICVLLKITRPWRTYLKIEISYSHNIRFKFVCFYCIYFVYGPSSFIKSLTQINLIEINLQNNCQYWEKKLL